MRLLPNPLALTGMVLILLHLGVNAHAAPQDEMVEVNSPQKAIPIEYLAHLTTVDAFINGNGPYKVVLDTGAGVTVLDNDLVKTLNLSIVGTSEIESPMGEEPIVADSLQVRSIEIGDAVIKDAPAVAMELRDTFGPLEAPDAIVSAASFEGFLITIDYPNNVVHVREGQLPPADGRRVLDYSSTSVVPVIPLIIAGETVQVAIDTGAPSAFVMPTDFISALPLESEPAVAGHGRTVDASFDILSSTLRGTISIGDIVFENPTVTFSEPVRQPHVGMEVLCRYAITIDRTNRRIMFDQSQSAPESGSPVQRVIRMGGSKSYGIMLSGLSGDVLEVRGVEEGLAAAEAGLKSGDRIIAINGRLVKSLSNDERIGLLRGSPLVLKVDRAGSVIEITLSLD
jgi:predicted aspartyl protease